MGSLGPLHPAGMGRPPPRTRAMTEMPEDQGGGTTETAPRLSVIVPTYQRAHLLPRTIASLQAQTFGDFEVLVADDASTDDTPAVLAALAAADPRIKPVRLSRNS